MTMSTGTTPRKRLWQASQGPLITGISALIIAGLDGSPVVLPNPPAILVLALVFSAYSGGIVSGLLSASIAWLFIAVFFSSRGHPFHYTDENFRRVVVWAITMPITALLIGSLKNRTLRQFAELRESEIRFRSVMDNMVDAVFTVDERGVIKSRNPAADRLLGCAEQEVGDQPIDELFLRPDEPTSARAPGEVGSDRSLVKRAPLGLSGLPVHRREMVCRRRDGVEIPVEVSVSEMALRGQTLFIVTAHDIKERKQAEAQMHLAEEERARFHEELIRVQASAIAELSTPLIPVRSRILVMPLIGTVDSARASRVLEVLLHGISEHKAHSAILDVTGVPVVDTQVASALVRAATAARMLGARVVLTGIRPEVATTLVSLGAELRGVITCSTLEQGIDVAEAQERRAGKVTSF